MNANITCKTYDIHWKAGAILFNPDDHSWRWKMKRYIPWYLSEDITGYVIERIVTPRATSSLRAPSLGEKQWIKQQLGLLQVLRNVHIFVHPKYFWMLADWKLLVRRKGIATLWKSCKSTHDDTGYGVMPYLDKSQVVIIGRLRGGNIVTAWWERKRRFLHNIPVVEVSQHGVQEAPIPVVGDAASVVALPSQVSYGLEGHLIVLIDEQLK